jgi:hypothetical protein
MKKIIFKNKRGFLLGEETLKIIISVIAIGFLVYFLSSLYLTTSQQQKKVEASSTIERIGEIIKNLNVEEEIISSIEPSGWFIYSFVNEERPNSCAGQNCLCLCKKSFLGIKDQSKKCSEDGICEIVENLEKFDALKILSKGQTSLKILKDANRVLVEEIK